MRPSWWTRVLDFIAPRLCVVCQRRLAPTERTVCTVCQLHLPRTTFQFSPSDNVMARRFWGLVPIERAAALTDYEPHSEMAAIVYQLKYGDRPDIGEDMGRLMAREMGLGGFFDGIDALVPVPLSPRRQRQRGYNQSERLAAGVSQQTGIPVVTGVLRRRHFRQSQTTLSHLERQENVSDMFYVRHPERLQHRHVLLIDDIYTTGATLLACAEQLTSIPGISISILTFGRTVS